jgi:hypothetical protein
MSIHVKVGGYWEEIAADQYNECGSVKVNGTWRTITGTYVKVGTSWRTVCEPIPAFYAPYYAPPGGGGGGDPAQDSTIYGISPTSGSTSGGYTITVSGSFPSAITNISVGGTNIGGWNKSNNSVTFTMPAGSAGATSIQLFNGRVPLLSAQTFNYIAPGGGGPGGDPVVDCTTPTSTTNSQISVSTSICSSGLQNVVISYYNGACVPNTSTSYGSCVSSAVECGACGPQNNIPADTYSACVGYDLYNFTDTYQRKYCSNGTYSYDCPTVTTSSLAASNSSICGYVEAPCVCNYSRYGDYLIAPECCAGTNCCVQYSPITYYAPTFTYWAPYWTPYYAPPNTSVYYAPYYTPTTYYAPSYTYWAPYWTVYYAPPNTSLYYAPSFTYWAPYYAPTTYYAPYYGGGGGGGGCIVSTTRVQTPSGYKYAKDLAVGDEVYSVAFAELSDDETVDSVATWSSRSLTPTSMRVTKVKHILQVKEVPAYMRINGDYFSLRQAIMVLRDGEYKFVLSNTVKLGDRVINRKGPALEDLEFTLVTDLITIFSPETVYQFDTEEGDIFFTENMLVHNLLKA